MVSTPISISRLCLWGSFWEQRGQVECTFQKQGRGQGGSNCRGPAHGSGDSHVFWMTSHYRCEAMFLSSIRPGLELMANIISFNTMTSVLRIECYQVAWKQEKSNLTMRRESIGLPRREGDDIWIQLWRINRTCPAQSRGRIKANLRKKHYHHQKNPVWAKPGRWKRARLAPETTKRVIGKVRWLISCVSLTEPGEAQIVGQSFFWACLWRCFWVRLPFILED